MLNYSLNFLQWLAAHDLEDPEHWAKIVYVQITIFDIGSATIRILNFPLHIWNLLKKWVEL